MSPSHQAGSRHPGARAGQDLGLREIEDLMLGHLQSICIGRRLHHGVVVRWEHGGLVVRVDVGVWSVGRRGNMISRT